jgi:hypothetical protein
VDQTTLDTKTKYEGKANADAGHCVILTPTVTLAVGSFVNHVSAPALGAMMNVEDDAVLLIDAHGSRFANAAGGPRLWNGHDGTQLRHIIPSDLAQQIAWEGLPKTHVLVRMLSCYGAGPGIISPAHLAADQAEVATYVANDFFARSLARELGQRGYDRIRVGGYKGPTQNFAGTTTSVRAHAAAASSDRVLANTNKDQFMTWFDAQGNRTVKQVWSGSSAPTRAPRAVGLGGHRAPPRAVGLGGHRAPPAARHPRLGGIGSHRGGG